MSAPTAQEVASVGDHPGNQVYQEEEALYESGDEVIEEVTDDEEDEVAEEVSGENASRQEVESLPSTSKQSLVATPPAKPQAALKSTPSKVVPSPAVKNMKMQSPSADKGLTGYPSHLNPMNNFKNWTAKAFSDVAINFPILTTSQETTNELTRDKRPENRYWSGQIEFAANSFTSKTITINNVAIPFSDNKSYGDNFVYMCLPGYMADKFAEDGKKRRPTIVNENSLMPDSTRWWKAVNKIQDKFGVAIQKTNTFRVVPLPSIFSGTQKGIICNVELQFHAKASTMDRKPLSASDPQRVTVELVRGYIIQHEVDVQPPVRKPRIDRTPAPSKTGSDSYASDDLLAKLKQLGL